MHNLTIGQEIVQFKPNLATNDAFLMAPLSVSSSAKQQRDYAGAEEEER